MSDISDFLPKVPNNFSTQISSATVSPTALSFTINDPGDLPQEGVGQLFKKNADGEIVVGSVEFIHWTSVSGNTVSLTDTGDRGLQGSDSGAQSYIAGDYFEVWVSSYYMFDPDTIVTHTGTQELSNKTHDGDFKLKNATDNIQVNSADPYRTIVIPAAAFTPTTTAGCADSATVETSTNKINYKVLDFDKATEEHAFANFCMPTSWDGGTLLVKFEWTSTAASGDVVWGAEGRAFANDDAADQAVGTAVTVTDTITAAADFDFTAETSALTLAGTPAGGQSVYLQVFRKAADGADTLDADARLKSVILRYKVAQYSD